MNTQLRYVVRPGGRLVLQFRQGHITKSTTGIIGLERIERDEWQDVPIVAERDVLPAQAVPDEADPLPDTHSSWDDKYDGWAQMRREAEEQQK